MTNYNINSVGSFDISILKIIDQKETMAKCLLNDFSNTLMIEMLNLLPEFNSIKHKLFTFNR